MSRFRAAAMALCLAHGLATPGRAQETRADDFYATWRNVAGVLHYCEVKGHLTAELAEDGVVSLGFFLLNAPTVPTPAERALAIRWEQQGRSGMIPSSRRTVAEEAAVVKIPEARFCRNLRESALQLQPTRQRHEPGGRIGLQLGIVNYCRNKGHMTLAMADRIISVLRAEFAPLMPLLSSPDITALNLAARSVAAGKSWWDWRDKSDNQKRAGEAPAELCKDLSQYLGGDNAALLQRQ
jgi:hypothetical protein